MFFRVTIATFFLGIAAATHLLKEDTYLDTYLVYIYLLIGSIYVLTFIYLTLLFILKDLLKFSYFQIVVDIFLVTLLVFITGGKSSIYFFMYSISIISASIFLFLPGGILAAGLSSLLYSLIVVFHHYEIFVPLGESIISSPDEFTAALYFPVIVKIVSFFVVAFLASFLAEQTKKSQIQLQEKQVDLENLEVLNENIMQSIHSGLLTLDLENRLVAFNQFACEITGFSHSYVLHKHISEIFPEIILPDYSGVAAEDFQVPRFEISYKRKDDIILYLGFSLSTLRDKEGLRIGSVLGFQDITNIREMEDYVKRIDRFAALGRLAAGIAHEIRNPLASISGSVQVLSKNLKTCDEDKRLMDIIVKESKNLSLLISDFSQFARPVRYKKESVNLLKTVEEVVTLFKNSLDFEGLRDIRININEDININIYKHYFNQILWNLFINSAQSISDNKGEIFIAARVMEKGFMPVEGIDRFQESKSILWVEFKVRDTGCGIDSAKIDKIFDPFYTTKENGTGLGLSIVHKIVQDSGGVISAESKPGKGTVFRLYFHSS
jgi:two-component system sensor histidine kinase PilS (NtrC family)